MPSDDPLADLVIDAAELDRARIANALRGRIAIDRATSLPVVQPPFNDWDAIQKILGFLLARKATVLLGASDQEAAKPITIVGQTGLPPGTVRPTLRSLVQQRRVSQDHQGGYLLSASQVNSAIDALGVLGAISDTPSERGPRIRNSTRKAGKPRRLAPRPREKSTKTKEKVQESVVVKASQRSSGRSPTTLVKELVAQGFFDSPRTVGSVQKRLKDKAGHLIPITTLSPVFTRLLRSNVLDREETDEGAYAYERRKD